MADTWTPCEMIGGPGDGKFINLALSTCEFAWAHPLEPTPSGPLYRTTGVYRWARSRGWVRLFEWEPEEDGDA